jgi:hypothetical protein
VTDAVTNTQADPPLALLKKLLAATKAIEPVKKNGWNKAGEYAFVEAVDIVREGNRVLTNRKVLVIPSTVDVAWRFGQSAALATVTMEFCITDVESGESMTQRWIGAGYDKDCDKAVYQGETGAAKYFYSQLLSIPIENQDPEFDGGKLEQASNPEADRVRRDQDRAALQPDVKSPTESDPPAPDMEGLASV